MPEQDTVVRKTFSLSADLWRRIEDFQYQHRVKRDAEAIRQLLELGLAAARDDTRASYDPGPAQKVKEIAK